MNIFLPALVSILTICISLIGSYFISVNQTVRNINVERLSLLRQEFAKFSTAGLILKYLKTDFEKSSRDFIYSSYSLITLLDYDNKCHNLLRIKINNMIEGYTTNIKTEEQLNVLAKEVGSQFDIVLKHEREKLKKPWSRK